MASHLYILLILWTMIAIGVGVHATNRGRNGFLWGLLTVFTGLLGVGIYAVVLASAADADSDEPDTVRVCSSCGARQYGRPDYCSDCGEPLGEVDETITASILRSGSQGYCSNCKSKVGLDDDACSSCGAVF